MSTSDVPAHFAEVGQQFRPAWERIEHARRQYDPHRIFGAGQGLR
ncbi:hypothetical protein [Amycolatopsis albispora]|nr:hypothetical protein [Amycolatopsis albispora]